MQRRHFHHTSLIALSALLSLAQSPALALAWSDLSQTEAADGLKTALEAGALAAIGQLGQTDGFLGNAKVRIGLPGHLQDAARLLKTLGQGQRVEALVTAMNRAAEAAVPLARELLVAAVRALTVQDAKNILRGSDTAITRYFADQTRTQLTTQLLPVVTQATEQVDLVKHYNRVAGKAASFGLVAEEDANIQRYVTRKAQDGLFLLMGEAEQKIRRDPLGSGSVLLQKVFGALK